MCIAADQQAFAVLAQREQFPQQVPVDHEAGYCGYQHRETEYARQEETVRVGQMQADVQMNEEVGKCIRRVHFVDVVAPAFLAIQHFERFGMQVELCAVLLRKRFTLDGDVMVEEHPQPTARAGEHRQLFLVFGLHC